MSPSTAGETVEGDVVQVRIENRAQLVYLLTEAAELEHGILSCYLFTSFSIKNSTGEGLTEEQLAAVRRWRSAIREIVIQEMIHLASACNLLTAVGAGPQLRRPNLPTSPRAYPPAFKLGLVPFSREALDLFISLEGPESPAETAASRGGAVPMEKLSDIFASERHYETVGELYRGIEDGLTYLSHKFGEEQLFAGPPAAQTAAPYFDLPGIIPVHDLNSALGAIKVIVEQGEGAGAEMADSHYHRFLRIREEYDALLAKDPGFVAARPVLTNPYAVLPTDLTHSPDVNLLDDPLSMDLCNLFDGCYELMVQMLGRLFVHAEESEKELMRLADTTIGMMMEIIEPLGCALTLLPAGPSHPGMHAGPSFRLSRGATIPAHAESARVVFRERLVELSTYCRFLQSGREAPAVLTGVGGALSRYARSFEAW